MSSRSSRKARRTEQEEPTSQWSSWVWSVEYNCNYRYRLRHGEYDYDYDKDSATPRTPGFDDASPSGGAVVSYTNDPLTPQSQSLETSTYTSAYDPQATAVSSSQYQPYASGSAYNPNSTQYQAYEQPGPYSQNQPSSSTYSSGYGSYTTASSNDQNQPSQSSQYGVTAPSTGDYQAYNKSGGSGVQTITEGFQDIHLNAGDEVITDPSQLDPKHFWVRGKEEGRTFWKPGRVLKCLYTEQTASSSRGDQFSETMLGGWAYTKVQRFVVVGVNSGSCVCHMINTYSNQGTLKENLPHRDSHAIIHTTPRAPERICIEYPDGTVVSEERLRTSIKITPHHPHDDFCHLKERSRLNYSKTYTVEMNIPVGNIGMVDPGSMSVLLKNSPHNHHKHQSRGGHKHPK